MCWIDATNVFTFQKHLETCKNELVPCDRHQCTDKLMREEFKIHMEKLCKWREINCDYCSQQIFACRTEVSATDKENSFAVNTILCVRFYTM